MSRRSADPLQEVTERHRRADDLASFTRFLAAAADVSTPHALIELALQTVLNQTSAGTAAYFDPNPLTPAPKAVLPDSFALDLNLAAELTRQAVENGCTVWLAADAKERPHTDAICVPLKSATETFGTLHAYRTGRAFQERDVRFIETFGGFLAEMIAINRHRRKLEAENARLRAHAPAPDDLIGESVAVTHLRQQIVHVASQSLPVLIRGESGSGKELVALAIHRSSHRACGPLAVVNCANLAPGSLDGELFGHMKGAFNGADADHCGILRRADDGTIFFDEIADLSAASQGKLLRIIEEKTFRPLGATRDAAVDVRIIAGTARDLEAEVRAGRFRADLLSRLGANSIRVPALRERLEDVPELANFFLTRIGNQCRRNLSLSPEARERLQSHTWPGNVRQLRAIVESAAVISDSDILDAEAFILTRVREEPVDESSIAGDPPPSLNVDDLETWAIRRALRQTGGNVSHAARVLGMSRDTLHTKIKKKSINRDAPMNSPNHSPSAATRLS
jgi:two-component system, NtrC family, response regulator HydG